MKVGEVESSVKISKREDHHVNGLMTVAEGAVRGSGGS